MVNVKMRICGIAILILCGCQAPTRGAVFEHTEDYSTLKYADLVVMGTIESVVEEEYSYKKLYGLDDRDRPDGIVIVKRVTIAVQEVLRGSWSEGMLTVLLPTSTSFRQNYETGESMVVSCLHRPNLEGYQVWGDSGRFIRDGEDWVCQRARPGAERITDQVLREIVQRTALPEVQEDADVIIEGEVINIEEFVLSGPDGTKSRGRRFFIRPTKVYKGTPGATVTMLTVTSGKYSPHWRRSLPANYKIGDRFVAFLKAMDGGYYPFSGSNGLFRVRDDQLVYDQRRPYRMNLGAMRQLLEKEAQQ